MQPASATRGRKQRFVAPARTDVDPRRFDELIFDRFRRHSAWWSGADSPSLEAMNAALGDAVHPYSGASLRFVEQTLDLLSDGLHYEQRIFERGAIATRADNWHDLFNALIWIEYPAIKAALNRRQVADIARFGPTQRSRAQCALTQFDEAGVVVVLRDPSLLALWDAHDWHGLFWREREAWCDGRAQVVVFGHAMLEHALRPHPVHTAKCIVAQVDEVAPYSISGADVCARVAEAIAAGELLNDPQEPRPMPLSGLPGWHPDGTDESFFSSAPCFRPLRPGRQYPPPLRIDSAAKRGES